VAALARKFATKWGAGEWGHYAGLWHDLGKFSADFQDMISADAEAERGKVNHSSAGALRACEELREAGLVLAFVIAGHHSGLRDYEKLLERLQPDEKRHLDAAVAGGADADWLRMQQPLTMPAELLERPRSAELWIRFLFSALIDGDRLDTECFHDPAKTSSRGSRVTMRELAEKVDADIDRLAAEAREVGGATAVNDVRAAVLADCRARADEEQGIFTLTVPTGGGKTLASLSFALRHAAKHQLDRVIVVVPYTSIIEQNAAVLKKIVGEENVLEHHTNFDPGDGSKFWLDAENWDVPIVVTTSVQFFESLFANKTSAVRKLHNIARGVVVFDEVQTLPPPLLKPIVEVMGELSSRFGASLVLCTATQPALQKRQTFPEGFVDAREIVREPRRHFEALQRVEAHWPADLRVAEPWPELAARIAAHRTALVITHLRNDARLLCDLLPPGTIHLSAAMCPQHRTDVLNEIRGRLLRADPCRVVATQLVEAGVDLDFPIVFRALGGLDSLAQAAGRCNREGKLADNGRLEIFVAETQPPPGELRTALAAARIVAQQHGGKPDLFGDPLLYRDYFLQFYSTPADPRSIQTDREACHFETVAKNFQMIENGQESVIIPFDETCRHVLQRLKSKQGSPRLLRRRLQRYSVAVSRAQFTAMRGMGAVLETEPDSGTFVLADVYRSMYDRRFGLLPPKDVKLDPESFIA
jgi:CRISPR-associated endonuclease/helicase Cas3